MAGKDSHTGEWIRIGLPNRYDPCYFGSKDLSSCTNDPTGPRTLTCYSIQFTGPKPQNHHPEDWIAINGRWNCTGSMQYTDLRNFIDRPPLELLDIYSTSTDRISSDYIAQNPLGASLHLIEITPSSSAVVKYYSKYGSSTTYKPKFEFSVNGRHYSLSITDPRFPNTTVRGTDIPIPEGFVALGLGQKYFNGYTQSNDYYKLALTIFTSNNIGGHP